MNAMSTATAADVARVAVSRLENSGWPPVATSVG